MNINSYVQILNRNALRVPVLYPRPIGRGFTTILLNQQAADFYQETEDAHLLSSSEPTGLQNIEAQALASGSLTLLSAGPGAMLVVDHQNRNIGQAIFSLETRHGLESVETDELLVINSLRPGTGHDMAKLSLDLVYLVASQYLVSQYIAPVFYHWLNEIFDKKNQQKIAVATAEHYARKVDGDSSDSDSGAQTSGDQKKNQTSPILTKRTIKKEGESRGEIRGHPVVINHLLKAWAKQARCPPLLSRLQIRVWHSFWWFLWLRKISSGI